MLSKYKYMVILNCAVIKHQIFSSRTLNVVDYQLVACHAIHIGIYAISRSVCMTEYASIQSHVY